MASVYTDLLTTPNWQERIRALTLHALQAVLRSDLKPKSTAEAVYHLRTKSKSSARQLAATLGVTHATVSRLEGGLSRGTPSLMLRLAGEAETHGMANTAGFFRYQAQVVEREVRTRGGRRQ